MKIQKKIIAMNLSILTVVIFCVIYIFFTGDNYTVHTGMFFEGKELPKTNVAVEDKSIVKLDSIRMENGEVVADFSSVSKGMTKVKVSCLTEDGDTISSEFEFKVNNFGTLFDRTNGSVSFKGFRVIIYTILAELLLTFVFMIWMFIDYRRKANFSYPMIACGGVSIYVAILFAYILYYLLNNTMHTFSFFLYLVSNAGMIMLLLLTPFMLLLSLLLAVSNVWLMRNEGYRPVNALGIVFAVLWFIGTMLTLGMHFMPELHLSRLSRIINYHLTLLTGYMECMFISTVACSYLAAKYKPPFDRDFIIILGCAIRKDGTLTPLLKARADSAISFEKEQFQKNNKHAVFIPSGGQGADEVISEGEAMENYLAEAGIPRERIAREDKSVNTFQNMKFSKKIIDGLSDAPEKKIAFATTNYHVFRGYILSRKNGFKAIGISAKTKPYFFPNAFLREFIGLLVDQKWKHFIFIVLMILGFLQIGIITGI